MLAGLSERVLCVERFICFETFLRVTSLRIEPAVLL